MNTLTCAPGNCEPSEIRIADGLVRGGSLSVHLPERAGFVLADRRILELYPGVRPSGAVVHEIDGGEGAKTFVELERVLRSMARVELDRDAVLAALGGGAVGDLAGLAASLFLRGIGLVQVPTTLLSMVDSSVGGKTAINLPEGKNLVGTFWPAREVLIDPGFVRSLSEQEFRSGLGEVLKVAVGLSAVLFDLLETERKEVLARDPQVLERVIGLALEAKIRIVEDDPREIGNRRLLNLGHTLGHALEAASSFAIAHGIAVARGIRFAVERSETLGFLAADKAERCRQLLADYGFEDTPLPAWKDLDPFLRRDKKLRGGRLQVVLPTDLGASCLEPMGVDDFTGRGSAE